MLVRADNLKNPEYPFERVVNCSNFETEAQMARRAQGSAQSYEDLVRIGHRRGMANPSGWARHVLAAREAKRERSGPVRVVA